jgi:predicted nucleic acid-binding protein
VKGFLLDTVALSDGLKKQPNRGLLKWLAAVEDDDLYISALTVAELQKGIAKLSSHDPRRLQLERWLVFELLPRFGRRVLTFDAETARHWGNMVAAAAGRGSVLSIVDSQIAATASLNSLKVVTRNERDFVASGVGTLNPWSA